MKQAITYRNIWRVSYPIILSSTAQNLVNAADTAFLGRLGDHAVGAAGNSIIFYFVFVVTAIGFSVGGQILVGRKNGEGKYAEVGKIIDHCVYVFIPLSIFLFVVLKFVSPFLLSKVTHSQEILQTSIDFLNYRVFGIFFALTNVIFRIIYVGITHTRILTTSTFLMAGVNVVLDYLLIFGNFGFPEMGVKGAALASVIAEASTTVFFIYYTRKQKQLKKYELFRFARWERPLLDKLIRISSPTMVQSFLALGSWLVFFLIIEKMGARELAISHIVRSIYMVMIIPLFGFSQATSTLVSNVIGQGDVDHVTKLVRKSVLLCLGCTAIFFPFIYFFPENVLSIYTRDPGLLSEAIPVLHVVNVAMLFFSIAYILFSAVSGTGRTIVSMMIEMITLVVYLTVAFIIGIELRMDLPVVWYSEFIYFGMMGTLSLFYLKFGRWKHLSI